MKLDSTAMTFGGSALTVRKADVMPGAKKTMSDTYAEHSKIVFLFDASGSMGCTVAADVNGASLADAFIWTPEKMTEIGEACYRAVQKVSEFNARLLIGTASEDDDPGLDAFESQCVSLCRENMFADVKMPTDDEIKARIVRNDKTLDFGILPVVGKSTRPPTRMELVKRLASVEINARFKKFPNARVAVVAFGGNAVTLFDDGEASQVDAAVAQLDENGMKMPVEGMSYSQSRVNSDETNILGAVSHGMDICRAKPSAVGVHHFILVTDGSANGNLETWVPVMKSSGVVLDYIHIGENCYVNDGVKAACAATGGEFMVCNTEKDIAEKFTLAAARLCLPPAPTK